MDDFKSKKFGSAGVGIVHKKLSNILPDELLDKFQFIVDHHDQFEPLDETKIRIFWSHLEPEQNEEVSRIIKSDTTPLANKGWQNFHKIVFISHHQMENWIRKYNIPRSYCTVIKYGLTPVSLREKSKDKITIFHHPSPQRGLSLLVDVFEELSKKYSNLELKVCSSYKIYTESNNSFLETFDRQQSDYEKSGLYAKLEKNPFIKNLGYIQNEELRMHLASSHIFAYPSILPETFCLSLLESMSAGLLCVHSSFGCLPETASNLTMMYDYHENLIEHKKKFHKTLDNAIKVVNSDDVQYNLKKQKEYVDYCYDWGNIKNKWLDLLTDLEKEPLKKIKKKISFKY